MPPPPAVESALHPREHPWERMRRSAFSQWEAELRRTPYGRPVADVVGFAHSIEPPAHWADSGASRRLFALSALPTGTGATYLATVPARSRRPSEGALVRLSRPTKGVLPGPDARSGEIVLEARLGSVPATWEEVLPGAPTRSASTVVPLLSEIWHLPPPVVESLLLPVVGSMPWHGRPAGLDLCVEVEGWSMARHRLFLKGLLDLVPDWVSRSRRRSSTSSGPLELASGARIRRGSLAAPPPFSVLLRSVSSPPAPLVSTTGAPRSILSYGHLLASEFTSYLSAGQGVLLLSAMEARTARRIPEEVPDNLRATVWALHWMRPEPPDLPEWYRWLRREEPRLRDALNILPGSPSDHPHGEWGDIVERRGFRDRLAQGSIGKARLRAASEVEEVDFRWVVDSIVTATERAALWASAGRGPLTRSLDRSEGGRTVRLKRAFEELFQGRAEGFSPSEAMAELKAAGTIASEREVEDQLERLRIRGVLFQERSGRYRVA